MTQYSARSIHSLRKIDTSNIAQYDDIDHSVVTLNIAAEKSDLLKRDSKLSYLFQSRFTLFRELYDFALEYKLTQGKPFDESKESKKQFINSRYNESNTIDAISSAEYEILIKKIIESFKSIEKNKYIAKLILRAKEYISSENKTIVHKPKTSEKKEIEQRLKQFHFTTEKLLDLQSEDWKAILQYSVFASSENIIAGLTMLKAEVQGVEEQCDTIILNVQNLLETLHTTWDSSFLEVQKLVVEFKNEFEEKYSQDKFVQLLIENIILRLFFTFHTEFSSQTKQKISSINSSLNSFTQSFLDDEEEAANIFYDVWHSNWENKNILEKIKKACNSYQTHKLHPDTKSHKKEKNNQSTDFGFKIEIPEDAPSLPTYGDPIRWISAENSTSSLLTKYPISQLALLDYICDKLYRDISKSIAYTSLSYVYRLSDTSFDPKYVKQLILEKDENKIVEFLDSIPEELIEQSLNTAVKKRKEKQVYIYSLTHYYTDSIQKRLQGKKKRNKKFPILKLISNTKNLTKKEVYKQIVLREVHVLHKHFILHAIHNLLDSNSRNTCIQKCDEWYDIVHSYTNESSSRRNKLLTNKELRYEYLTQKKWMDSKLVDSLIEEIGVYAKKLEKHLLLDSNYTIPDEPFIISDTAAFNTYNQLTTMIVSSFNLEKNELKPVQQSALSALRKLSQIAKVTIPLKIDRMTPNKPNGKSLLLFDIDIDSKKIRISHDKKRYKNQYTSSTLSILTYPITVDTAGAEVKFVDSWKKAVSMFNKGKFEKICVGFLNGSGDVAFGQKLYVINDEFTSNYTLQPKDGKSFTAEKDIIFKQLANTYSYETKNIKGYRTYTNFSLTYHGISYIDPYRPSDTETVARTNPPGYPQLYFVLIPKNPRSLITKIETSRYYLNKYTPYRYITKYFDLLLQLEDELQSNNSDAENTIKNILDLRCLLRLLAPISSIETSLQLIPKLELKNNNAIFVYEKSIKYHLQFQQAVATKQSIIQYRPNIYIAVDLGEKQFASISVISQDSSDTFTVLKQAHLPMNEEEFTQWLASDQVTPSSNYTSSWFDKYEKIQANLKKWQKRGSYPKQVRKKRKGFTESVEKKITSQLTKLVVHFNAAVIFEKLAVGFGRKDTAQIYTETRRLLFSSLQSFGYIRPDLVLRDWEEKSSSYVLSNTGYNTTRVGQLPAAYTSQYCRKCGTLPLFKPEFYSISAEDDAVVITSDLSDKELRITVDNDQIQLKGSFYCAMDEYKNQFTKNVFYYKNKNGQTKTRTLYETLAPAIHSFLKDPENQKKKNALQSKLKQTIVWPRPSQDIFVCPHCGYTANNADLHASENIASFFHTGMELKKSSLDGKTNPTTLEVIHEMNS